MIIPIPLDFIGAFSNGSMKFAQVHYHLALSTRDGGVDHTGMINPSQVLGHTFVAEDFVRKLTVLNGPSQIGAAVCVSNTALNVLCAVSKS